MHSHFVEYITSILIQV